MIDADPKNPPVDAGQVPWSNRANRDSVVQCGRRVDGWAAAAPGTIAPIATDFRLEKVVVVVVAKRTTMSAAWLVLHGLFGIKESCSGSSLDHSSVTTKSLDWWPSTELVCRTGT
jgi:hypothetical protein